MPRSCGQTPTPGSLTIKSNSFTYSVQSRRSGNLCCNITALDKNKLNGQGVYGKWPLQMLRQGSLHLVQYWGNDSTGESNRSLSWCSQVCARSTLCLNCVCRIAFCCFATPVSGNFSLTNLTKQLLEPIVLGNVILLCCNRKKYAPKPAGSRIQHPWTLSLRKELKNPLAALSLFQKRSQGFKSA